MQRRRSRTHAVSTSKTDFPVKFHGENTPALPVTRKGKRGRLLSRPQRDHPAAPVDEFVTAVLIGGGSPHKTIWLPCGRGPREMRASGPVPQMIVGPSSAGGATARSTRARRERRLCRKLRRNPARSTRARRELWRLVIDVCPCWPVPIRLRQGGARARPSQSFVCESRSPPQRPWLRLA